MLCPVCWERPATLHIITLINGEKHEADYCEECEPPFPPPEMEIGSFVLDLNPAGKACVFCGAPAVSAPVPAPLMTFCCSQCTNDFERLVRRSEQESPQPSDPHEFYEWSQSNGEEAARRMRERKEHG